MKLNGKIKFPLGWENLTAPKKPKTEQFTTVRSEFLKLVNLEYASFKQKKKKLLHFLKNLNIFKA